MDSDDGMFGDTASTDTSNFLRQLEVVQALNTSGGSGTAGVSQSVASSGLDVSGSGDVNGSRTLTQALKPIHGTRPSQIINLAENKDESSASVYGKEVEVYVAPTSSNFVERSAGSNKVKITPVVNHVWELKYYCGNLVAVHRDSTHVAYVLQGKTAGNVRVISRKTADRVLLKSFTGDVMDIAFALSDDIYLAAVDEAGNLFVYSFTMDGDSIIHQLVMHVKKEALNLESDFKKLTRIIWCPYMPEEEADTGDTDPAKMLVLLYGTQAEIWNVDVVSREYGSGPLTSKSVSTGVMTIEAYEPHLPVVNAAFAPDGSAIAVAYYSGFVKFFLVDLDSGDNESECMYDWNPHDGLPVTCMYFLDDHKHPVSDLQLWKFALTGAKYNTEIKIWSCESWVCVQTLNFHSPLNQLDLSLKLNSEIDLTSKYLTLSDINSRVLYVLQVHQDYSSSTAHISSLSQFPLTQPCLSCAIYDASTRKFKHSADDSHMDEITTGELDHNHEGDGDQEEVNGLDGKVSKGVQIKMYGVHTKSLQELLIRYRPETSVPPTHTPSISSMSQECGGLRDMLSDVSLEPSERSHDVSAFQLENSEHMLPPEAFTTSSPSLQKGSAQGEATHLSASSTSSFTQVSAMNEDLLHMGSPLSSVDPSTILSPSSTFAQTPSQVKASPNGNTSLLDIPLPPIASGEEDELTPRNSLQDGNRSGGVPSANNSLNASSRSNNSQKEIDEMFAGTQPLTPSGLGHSIETNSSTGSFPVVNLDAFNDQEDRYDENDKEVAEALGEDEEREVEDMEDTPMENLEERKEVVWPEPPDVSTEAKRLVDQAIEQGTQEEEDKDPELYDENDEAEIEEIIQQNDDEADDEGDGNPDDYPKRPHRPEPNQAPVHVLTNLDSSLAALTRQFQMQQEMMQQMQSELNQQRDLQLQLHRQQIEQQQLQQVAAQQPSLEQDIGKLEDILVSRMEHSLAQHMQRETQRLQDSLKKSDVQRKQRDDSLHSGVVIEVSKAVKDTVATTLRTEIKQTVSPALHRFIEPMKEKIHQEVAHRLTACDTLLRDNIAKAVKSRSTMDILASSIGDVMYQQMQQAYTDTFKSAMLPSFKDTMEKTVRDVHGIFQQGTKEYQLYMRQNMDSLLKEKAATEDIVKRMENAQLEFVSSIGQMKGLILNSVREELGGQIAHALSRYREELLTDVKKMVNEEVTSALREHGASISDQLNSYLRSGAATPVPLSTEEEMNKEKIMRELRAGRINDAFQIALSASNLDLVVYTCESAAPLNIFQKVPCPLSQAVLLSLISQLSANLEKHFDLKLKFLEDAVMFLDPEQQMTMEHIPRVLDGLVQRLQASNAHSGDIKKMKNKRMLIMAANSISQSAR